MVRIVSRIFLVLALVLPGSRLLSQSIQQWLVIVENQGTLNGNFKIALQVKGTNLPAANTLGSATIDVYYDKTKLTFVSGSGWAFGAGQGYTRSATSNNVSGSVAFIRVGVTGGAVGPSNDTYGYDIPDTFATWVTLNFTIANPSASTTDTIRTSTNAIGLFQNHANNPQNGVITNQTLAPPLNIYGSALPIQLAQFSCSRISEQSVNLTWSTASESNNYGFEVQRSREKASGFATLPNGFVAGHGTTVTKNSYTWTDATPNASEPWYRLKQIDLDGTPHYSEAITVSGTTGINDERAPIVFALQQNYPNPFNPTTQFKFCVEKTALTTVKIYNVIGQEVAMLFNGVAEPGKYYHLRLDGGQLASGVYFYRLQSGTRSDIKKMVLVR